MTMWNIKLLSGSSMLLSVSGLNDHATTPITAPIILDLNNDGFIFESINDSKVILM